VRPAGQGEDDGVDAVGGEVVGTNEGVSEDSAVGEGDLHEAAVGGPYGQARDGPHGRELHRGLAGVREDGDGEEDEDGDRAGDRAHLRSPHHPSERAGVSDPFVDRRRRAGDVGCDDVVVGIDSETWGGRIDDDIIAGEGEGGDEDPVGSGGGARAVDFDGSGDRAGPDHLAPESFTFGETFDDVGGGVGRDPVDEVDVLDVGTRSLATVHGRQPPAAGAVI